MAKAPGLPPIAVSIVDSKGNIASQWYHYLKAADTEWRGKTTITTTASTGTIISNEGVSIFTSTPGVIHILEDPTANVRKTLISVTSATQAGSVIVQAATDVSIGPSGENGLVFPTSISTYDLIELIGTSTSQWYIISQTTNVSVTASS